MAVAPCETGRGGQPDQAWPADFNWGSEPGSTTDFLVALQLAVGLDHPAPVFVAFFLLGGERLAQLKVRKDLRNLRSRGAQQAYFGAAELPPTQSLDGHYTDGFEPAILRGAQDVLASSKSVVFYEWHPDYYNVAGENDTSHADFLMELGYDSFMIFTNRGELLLRVRRPGHDVLASLAGFSRARRRLDNWHFDVAAFPTERLDACERLWCHYSKPSTALAGC